MTAISSDDAGIQSSRALHPDPAQRPNCYLTLPLFLLLCTIPLPPLPLSLLQIRVAATFHYIDSWQGETAFARVDDSYVWTDRYDSSPAAGSTKGNICGKPDVPEMKFAHSVDIVAPHDPMATKVKISFGTTLDAEPSSASWGVSSIAVYIR
jgi:hypothetical protein